MPHGYSQVTASRTERESFFRSQLKTIFSALPKSRQTLLFSATITKTLEELRSVAMTDPFFYTAPAEVATVEELDQRYVLTPSHVRDAYLVHVLQRFLNSVPKGSVVIFTSTCKYAATLLSASSVHVRPKYRRWDIETNEGRDCTC